MARPADFPQLRYADMYLPSQYSDILLNNFFYNSFLQPGVTYTNKYQMGDAGQIFVPKLHQSEVHVQEPCGDFKHENINNELLQITLNNTFMSSKKIHSLQAITANYRLVADIVRLSAREMAEAWSKSGLAALITEGKGNTMATDIPRNLTELKHDLLGARTEMYKNKRSAKIVVCSPNFYQLVLEYAGTLFTPTINDRMVYSGEVGTWLGLNFINMNLLQYAAGPFEYINYSWEKKTVTPAQAGEIAYILYDPEAFSVLINFNRSRTMESPGFMGQYVQSVINSGFRVTDPDSVFIRRYGEDLIDVNATKKSK